MHDSYQPPGAVIPSRSARPCGRGRVWRVPSSWALETVDTTIDLVVLLVLAQVIGHIARQRREIQVLEGLLPICGFCKRIRDESGGWLQLEHYIAERSEASFSHTFCPET